MHVTLLEAAAAIAMLLLALTEYGRLGLLLRRPQLPLLCISGYALVHAVSAGFVEDSRTGSYKFAMRMAAMAAFAWLVAAAPGRTRRAAIGAIVATGLAVAVLAVLEGAGWRRIDGVLALFREAPFNVGGARRATGGSEYPTQAAAFLGSALLAWAGLADGMRRGVCLTTAWLLSAGLLFTYSRGVLAATALALLLVVALNWKRRTAASLTVLAAVASATLVFSLRGEVFRLRLGSEGTQAWYGARYEPAQLSLAIEPGASLRTPVRLTNNGHKTWSRAEAFHLSYHWYNIERRTLQDGGRTDLPGDVQPGESVLLQPRVVAPALSGRYLLIWDMVQEDTTWFSGQGVRPGTVSAVVGLAPASAGASGASTPPPELGWHPRRFELWRIAADMWQRHPVLGVGPDGFRWLYGRYAGRPFWDTRVFSNNTLLEAAATTGSLGALALALTYAAALGASFRRMSVAAPESSEARHSLALLGVLIGLVIHGTVDYVLAFTGHYLCLGLVVGAISGPPLDESDLP